MEYTFEKRKGTKSKFPSTLFNSATGHASREVCDAIQDEQNQDFKKLWSRLHQDIALVCLCGNHDIGNRPTPRSIARFRSAFGDEYLAFWANGSYNIVLNNVLFIASTPQVPREYITLNYDGSRVVSSMHETTKHIVYLSLAIIHSSFTMRKRTLTILLDTLPILRNGLSSTRTEKQSQLKTPFPTHTSQCQSNTVPRPSSSSSNTM